MVLSKEDMRAFEWVDNYADGGEICIECPHSRPVFRHGHECVVEHPLDCPALPEDEFYNDGSPE